MNNRIKLIIIAAVCFLIVGIIGMCLFFSFGKSEKVDLPKKDDNEEAEVKEGYDEFGNKLVVVYNTKEEVYDVIVNNYLKKGEIITETREENGCWYYPSSNGVDEYFYCIDDPIIRVKSSYTMSIDRK